MSDALHIVILAAGQGKRMNSALPKVLHPLGGKPLLHHVLDTAIQLNPQSISVVYGHGGDKVKQSCANYDVDWIFQDKQRGTGHAVGLALQDRDVSGHILVMYGDVPLLPSALLAGLVKTSSDIGVLTAIVSDPLGYGRIVRNEETIVGIVEQRDASPSECEINEINTGILCADSRLLKELLDQVDSNNDQGEIYLTDIIALAHQSGIKVSGITTENEMIVSGVNNKSQLSDMERYYQKQSARLLMDQGVTIQDPNRIDIRGTLTCGRDVIIDVNCIFEGDVVLGDDVRVGASCMIKGSRVGAGCEIKPYSVIEEAKVASGAVIGPFARLRPGSHLADGVHIGNFVEIKNSNIAQASKVNHLSYIGDSDVGQGVNIGAGTITCNYDGANKHRTTIEDDVFIGSGNELVAPITIGKGSTTGAGSTLNKNVEADHLAVTRSPVKTVKGWKRPRKEK